MIAQLLWVAGAAIIATATMSRFSDAAADQSGERLFQRCYSCHSTEPSDNLPSGPTLHTIVGKPVAAEREFDYSPALRSFARNHPRWTAELLDRFIADPQVLVPGTHMGFPGIADAADRAALIAYLERTQPADPFD